MNIVILIPAYKPDERFVEFVRVLRDKDFSVLSVDDGSGEEFAQYFNDAEALGVKVVHHEVNKGKGRALRTGLEEIQKCFPDADGVVTADCDGQHTPEDLIKVMNAMEENPKAMIIGGRFSNKDDEIPVRSKIGNTITRWAFRIATGLHIRDTQTGLRGIPAYLFHKMAELEGERYEYEMNMLLYLKEWSIPYKEIPIETVYFDNNAGSHYNTFKDSWRIFKQLIKYCTSSVFCLLLDYVAFIILGKFVFIGGFDVDGILADVLPDGVAFLAAKFSLAYLGARFISSIANYILNSRVVFKSTAKSTVFKYFLLVVVVAFVGSFVTELLFNMGIPVVLCKILVDLPLFVFNYFAQREFVFKKKIK